MTGLALLVALPFAYLLEIAVTPPLAIGGARPALVVAVVVYTALTRRAGWGMAAGLLGGFLIDALSPGPFGSYAAAGVVLGFLVGNLWGAVYRDRWPAQALSLLAGVVVSDVIASVIAHGGRAPDTLADLVVHRSLPSGVYTALVCPPLFALVTRAFRVTIRWDSVSPRSR